MNDRRVLLVLIMAFVALAALVAIQSAQQRAIAPTSPAGIAASTPVFLNLTTADIQAIRLRSPETGATFILERAADGSWTAPGTSGTLNQTEADLIARTMVVLPYDRTVTLAANADLKAYGFTPEGVLSIEIVLANGATHAVAVGYRTLTENNYYALVDNLPALYLIERAPIDYLISRLKSPPVA